MDDCWYQHQLHLQLHGAQGQSVAQPRCCCCGGWQRPPQACCHCYCCCCCPGRTHPVLMLLLNCHGHCWEQLLHLLLCLGSACGGVWRCSWRSPQKQRHHPLAPSLLSTPAFWAWCVTQHGLVLTRCRLCSDLAQTPAAGVPHGPSAHATTATAAITIAAAAAATGTGYKSSKALRGGTIPASSTNIMAYRLDHIHPCCHCTNSCHILKKGRRPAQAATRALPSHLHLLPPCSLLLGSLSSHPRLLSLVLQQPLPHTHHQPCHLFCQRRVCFCYPWQVQGGV